VIICLGGFAWNGVCRVLRERGVDVPTGSRFGHGSLIVAPPFAILGSYHPSQQNTFTGRLTRPMLDHIMSRARKLAGSP
jgi:uracil-DNA glycosylase